MSQENLDLTHRTIDAFNRRDLDALLALLDDDAEVAPGAASIEGNYHGHAGFRRWWESLFEGFSDFTTEVVELRDVGVDRDPLDQSVGPDENSRVAPFNRSAATGEVLVPK